MGPDEKLFTDLRVRYWAFHLTPIIPIADLRVATKAALRDGFIMLRVLAN